MRSVLPLLVVISLPLAFALSEDEPHELHTFDISVLVADRYPGVAPLLGPRGIATRAKGYGLEVKQALEPDTLADLIRETITPDCWDPRSKPVIAWTFEGMAAAVTPRLTLDRDTVEIDLDFLLSTRRRAEPFEPNAPPLGPVELVETGRIRIDSTVRVPTGRVYVLGAGPAPSDPTRTLALVIRPMID